MSAARPAADGGLWCGELELSGDRPVRSVVPLSGHRSARVLVRLHGEPLGYVPAALGADGVDAEAVAQAATERFADRITAHLTAEGRSPVASSYPPAGPRCPQRGGAEDPVSVVVCTRDRSARLVACLDALRRLDHPRLEILVVDNAPSDDSTRRVVETVAADDDRVRYVREPRPGLSAARNRALAEARGRYLAYTDDDVTVDPDWVQQLLRGFHRRPDVGCVTGLVATADVTGDAERYFDARAAGWGTRMTPRLFDLAGSRLPDVLYPYSAGIFGTGANLAVDRSLLQSLGGFDEALGAGSPTRGGEDLDLFLRVLRCGRAIAYEPGALVWHHHRADRSGLLRQMFGYGTGLSAFLTKCLLQRGTRGELLRRVPVGARRIARIRTETEARLEPGAAAPAGALLREFAGFAAGPVLYLRARAQAPGPSGEAR